MVRGIVTDGVSFQRSLKKEKSAGFRQAIIIIIMQAGQPVGGASVRVAERAKDLVASSRGEFWRLLTPGEPT